MTAAGFALGRVVGWMVAPAFGLVSFARRARTFHPRGPTFHAAVARHVEAPVELHAVADRMVGPALVRFSGALWKHAEGRRDVLGCAIRLRRDDRATAEPAEDDQDLLFATIRRPWTMPFAPLATRVGDYLANHYFAVSPFDVGLELRVYLRLRPEHPSRQEAGPRNERLARDVAQGDVRFTLEAARRPFGPWSPLLVVALERIASVDGEALRFRPFRQGRGVRPRGFVHALRLGAYALSQRARPGHEARPHAPPRSAGARDLERHD
jgi:hypothetical protein